MSGMHTIFPKEGRAIHYETVGDGPPLVMLHPAMIGSSIWHDLGYVDALADHHHLIMIDAVGCGLSVRPYDPDAYTLEEKCNDTLSVLDDLNIQETDVFGYSMGGALAFCLAAWAPERVRRMVAGGSCPGTKPPAPKNRKPSVTFDGGLDAFYNRAVERWRSEGVELSERSKDDLRAMDPVAWAARMECHNAEAYSSESIALNDQITCPTLLLVGSEDAYRRSVETNHGLISNCRHVVIPDRSHIRALIDVASVTREIRTFLA